MPEISAVSKEAKTAKNGNTYWNVKVGEEWAFYWYAAKPSIGDEVELERKGTFVTAKKPEDHEVDERLEETNRKIASAEAGSEGSRVTSTPPLRATKVAESPQPASVVEQIEKVSANIRGAKQDPETLSLGLIELATLHEQLGTMLAEALEAERSLELQLKFEKQRDILELRKGEGTTIVEAEAEAATRAKPLADQWLEAKKSVDMLRLKREDIRALLDVGRSRLSLIKEDIQNA